GPHPAIPPNLHQPKHPRPRQGDEQRLYPSPPCAARLHRPRGPESAQEGRVRTEQRQREKVHRTEGVLVPHGSQRPGVQFRLV
ncbi:hypothetical protein T484DRAFT_1875490, partial [Baffinella frigidus]